jgi:CMP-N,N'-diacetyllegionaminic acid synthase
MLAVIPARSGSKAIPKKNIINFCGQPLISWTIKAALDSKRFNRVIVSTDSEEIAIIAKSYGAEVPFLRPHELAQDDTPSLAVLQHLIEVLKSIDDYIPESITTLQPTSPLRTESHITAALDLFQNDPNADSLVSCIEVPHQFHPYSVMRLKENGYLTPYSTEATLPSRRQDKPVLYARNGAAIYITRTNRIKSYIFGGNLIPFYMSAEDSVDIDTYEDLRIAEYFFNKEKDNKKLR